MTTLDTRNLTKLKIDVRRLLKLNPNLLNDIAGYSLIRLQYSRSRIPRLSRFEKRQLRKIRNARRRWFVDNIIMHHKRIHDQNNKLKLDKSKENIKLNKNPKINRGNISLISKSRNDCCENWQNNLLLKERGRKIRGRIDSRKIRARSRWVSILG